MNISKISENNPDAQQINYKGKFILAENLSKQEAKVVELVNNTIVNGKRNNRILSRLPFDVFVSRSEKNPELLELRAFYKNFFTKEKESYCISRIHADGKKAEIDSLDFRTGLDWFSVYKKQHCGYNGLWEKIRTKLDLTFGI